MEQEKKKISLVCQKCDSKNLQLYKAMSQYVCLDCGNIVEFFVQRDKEKNHREMIMPLVKEWLDKHDKKGWKVLEIGHGYDDDFRNLFIEKGMEWHGLEKNVNISDELMERLQDKIKGRENYNTGEMEDMHMFKDNEFDFVFCCHTFEHSENPLQALKEMKRVCKKFVYIITPYHCCYHVLETDPDHLFVLTELQMKKLFVHVGFREYDIKEQKEGYVKSYNLISIGEV